MFWTSLPFKLFGDQRKLQKEKKLSRYFVTVILSRKTIPMSKWSGDYSSVPDALSTKVYRRMSTRILVTHFWETAFFLLILFAAYLSIRGLVRATRSSRCWMSKFLMIFILWSRYESFVEMIKTYSRNINVKLWQWHLSLAPSIISL